MAAPNPELDPEERNLMRMRGEDRIAEYERLSKILPGHVISALMQVDHSLIEWCTQEMIHGDEVRDRLLEIRFLLTDSGRLSQGSSAVDQPQV